MKVRKFGHDTAYARPPADPYTHLMLADAKCQGFLRESVLYDHPRLVKLRQQRVNKAENVSVSVLCKVLSLD